MFYAVVHNKDSQVYILRSILGADLIGVKRAREDELRRDPAGARQPAQGRGADPQHAGHPRGARGPRGAHARSGGPERARTPAARPRALQRSARLCLCLPCQRFSSDLGLHPHARA